MGNVDKAAVHRSKAEQAEEQAFEAASVLQAFTTRLIFVSPAFRVHLALDMMVGIADRGRTVRKSAGTLATQLLAKNDTRTKKINPLPLLPLLPTTTTKRNSSKSGQRMRGIPKAKEALMLSSLENRFIVTRN